MRRAGAQLTKPPRTTAAPPQGPPPAVEQPEGPGDRPGGSRELVRVAVARNLAEAEFIQGLLAEDRIPSVLRRTAGFDVPDFLAAGPRDVLVQGSTELRAREALLQAEIISDEPGDVRPIVSPARLLTGILVVLALGALAVWLMSLIVS
jgi:hypothetical protein